MGATIDTIRDQLINTIQEAFGGVTRDGGITLHEAEAIDDYASDVEQAAARALDTESRWQDVPDAEIALHHTSLSYFDPKGFRYYLPAYMVWSLKCHETSDSPSSDSTVFSLGGPPDDPDIGRLLMQKYCLFSEEEAGVICRFLRFMVDHGDSYTSDLARHALQQYWGRFCDGDS